MSKRVYLTKVLGNGDDTERDEAGYLDDALGAFRPSIYNPEYMHLWKRVSTIQTDGNGFPLAPYQICIVDSPDHTALRADPNLIALPDGSLDIKFSAFSPEVRTQVRDAMLMLGIPTSLIDGSTGTTCSYRQVLQLIGQSLDSTFNIERIEAE